MIQQFHFLVFTQKNKNSNFNIYFYPNVHSNIYESQGMEVT